MLTASEADQAGLGIPDDVVRAFAHGLGRAVLTQNRKHFRNLHAAGHEYSGVILCTEDMDFAALARRIDAVLGAAGGPLGRLLRVHRPPA